MATVTLSPEEVCTALAEYVEKRYPNFVVSDGFKYEAFSGYTDGVYYNTCEATVELQEK